MFCYVGSCIKLLYTKVEDYSNRVFVQKYIIKVHADINFYVKWENLWQMYVQANSIMPKRKGKTNFTKIELKNNSSSCYPSAKQWIFHLINPDC